MNKHSNVKTILVTGGGGFIGSNFLIYASELKRREKVDTARENFYSKKFQYHILAPHHKELDITNLDHVRNFFNTYRPEIVLNFAAHRDANSAEKQRGNKKGSAWRTNVTGVKNISEICQRYNSFLIHISTDMVFSGSANYPGPYSEDTSPEEDLSKLSWYGWTKAEAENILKNKKNVAIIRIGNVTQPIYDPRLDYIGKILYLFDQGRLYPLFHDQYLTLTSIPSIFDAVSALIMNRMSGIFHVASKNVFTPHRLGEYLIEKTRKEKNVVGSISIDKYLKRWPNRYPKFGGLKAGKSAKRLKIKLLDWEEFVDSFVVVHFKK